MKDPQTETERGLLLGEHLNEEGDTVVDLFRLIRGGFWPWKNLWRDWDDGWNEPVSGAPLAAMVFRWLRKSRKSLLLFGKVGTGKTHLAKLAGIYASLVGNEALFLRWPTYVEMCKKQKKTVNLPCFDFIVLDDVGAERVSSFTLSLLEPILDSGVRLLVTMNMSPGEWESALLQSGSEVKSDNPEQFEMQARRCADRLMAGRNGRFSGHVEVKSDGSRRRS